ncbi:hypothetical protein BDZ89DRAFT_1134612 [Hymenopellis radicata]|nr:hypothetical protein BDZ89DRAFT_1134612 [Hymenopellis radicata]
MTRKGEPRAMEHIMQLFGGLLVLWGAAIVVEDVYSDAEQCHGLISERFSSDYKRMCTVVNNTRLFFYLLDVHTAPETRLSTSSLPTSTPTSLPAFQTPPPASTKKTG